MAGKRSNRPDRHPDVARGSRHDVRQGLVDLATVVRIDAALVRFLLPWEAMARMTEWFHLGPAQEASPARQAVQQARVNLSQQACPQAVAAIGPPLPCRSGSHHRGHLRKPGIAVAVVGPVVARRAGTVRVVVAAVSVKTCDPIQVTSCICCSSS